MMGIPWGVRANVAKCLINSPARQSPEAGHEVIKLWVGRLSREPQWL